MLKNLRKLREEKGISQKQLGDVIRVSQQSVNKYENHSVEPDISTMTAIADYFCVSLDYLVGRTQIKSPAKITSRCDLTSEEQIFIEKYRSLNEKQKESIAIIIENYIQK